MECSDIRRHLSEYIDGQCPEDIRAAVAAHLQTCPDCREEYRQLSALSCRMRELPPQELPFDFATVMEEKLREEDRLHPRKKPVHKRAWVRALGLCACLVLVMFLAGLAALLFGGMGASTPADSYYEGISSTANGTPYEAVYDEWGYRSAGSDMAPAQEEMAADARYGTDSVDQEAIQRKIIMNWSLRLQVEDFDAAYDRIQSIARSYGGYVVSGYTYGNDSGSYRDGFISIRVEAGRAQQAVEDISGLGELQGNEFSSEDVTSEYYDIAARLTAYEAQEQRLLELYAAADTVSEMLEIESQLAQVRAQIESLQGTLNYYDQLTALSLIEISLYTPSNYSQSVEPRGWQGFVEKLKSGFLTGLNNTLDGLASFLVWLARLLPFLILLALIVVGTILIIRRTRGRKKH